MQIVVHKMMWLESIDNRNIKVNEFVGMNM